MKIIIINDNTKRLKHWQLKNPGADFLTFTHPNYVIEKALEDKEFISAYDGCLFLVDDFFAKKSLLHDESMEKIKGLFPRSKFLVSSGAHKEDSEVKGYHGSIGSTPLTIDELKERI